MRMKNASREARLRAQLTELSGDSLRHPEIRRHLACNLGSWSIDQRFPKDK